MSRVVTLPPAGPLLPDGAKSGGWWHETDEPGRVVCDLCPRECSLKPGDRGFCFVRENRDGQMVLTTYGRSTGFCIDPIEKKPLNHFFPGTSVLSFGTAGCNLGCKFCQNWSISKSREVERLSEQATPEAITAAASELGCRSVAFTYNDPIIWAEYAIDVARACQAAGIKTVAVTAGYVTPAARRPFFEVMDAANVDLKGFTEEFYQHLTLSHLEPVLETLRWLKRETDVWFEITNLVIPQANDSADEFRQMCDWILEHLGDGVPIHFTAFHPDFRMRDRERTPPETLLAAYDVARRTGIRFVYVGNVYDVQHQSTYCPECQQLLIERDWYELGAYHLKNNRCGHCDAEVAGHFTASRGEWGRQRMPVQIAKFATQLPVINVSNKGTPSMSTAERENVQTVPQVQIPQLSDSQKQVISHAASEIVAAAILGYPTEPSDSTLGGAADQTVLGCFLTIKRRGRLRGCCGFLGKPTKLLAAFTEAAVTTATRDRRLPSISPTELAYLDLQVSLLHSFRQVTAQGQARVAEVTVGRHGLQISRGDLRGLLLPSVATEGDLDSERFLQQVALKAGMPATAWKQDEAQLATFESLSFGGPFDASVLKGVHEQLPPLVSNDDVEKLAAFCRDNVIALVYGATPSYYLTNCADGTVQGATLTLHLPGRESEKPPRVGQLSIRPGLPLQGTLIELAKMASGMLSAGGFQTDDLNGMRLGLTVLSDPAMHGTVAKPDLEGLDSQQRALLVMENGKTAWVYDPKSSPQQLLDVATREAKIRTPETASITSLEAVSTETPVVVANVPQPQSGDAERPPAVAGTFYPNDADQLEQLVDQLIDKSAPPRQAWRAAMVPHAGLKYSGRIAAAVLQRIEIPETVIVLGPKHTRLGVEWAVAPHETWSLPGGPMRSDVTLARQLSEAIPDLELDATAHFKEHAIEVELPLLRRLAPDARVIGIAIGAGDLPRCREFATGLTKVLCQRDGPTLLVISSDMNHFATDAETRRLDNLALSALERLDPEDLYDTVRGDHISMCGLLPAVIVLETLRQQGQLEKCERIDYGTTADVTGDTSRVVGYAGVVFG